MRVERTMQPEWLSNAYLVWDEETRDGFFVDSGALLDEVVAEFAVRPRFLLRTHSHHDHVAHEEELCRRYEIEVRFDAPGVQAIATPGHADDHLCFVVDGLCFSGDLLFKDAVGGGDAAVVRESVLKLMELPDDTRVLPGHTDETTIGRERAENPFLRYWLGAAEALGDPVRVGGEDATLVVWSPDYDGKGKALVRSADGAERIVAGSRVERL